MSKKTVLRIATVLVLAFLFVGCDSLALEEEAGLNFPEGTPTAAAGDASEDVEETQEEDVSAEPEEALAPEFVTSLTEPVMNTYVIKARDGESALEACRRNQDVIAANTNFGQFLSEAASDIEDGWASCRTVPGFVGSINVEILTHDQPNSTSGLIDYTLEATGIYDPEIACDEGAYHVLPEYDYDPNVIDAWIIRKALKIEDSPGEYECSVLVDLGVVVPEVEEASELEQDSESSQEPAGVVPTPETTFTGLSPEEIPPGVGAQLIDGETVQPATTAYKWEWMPIQNLVIDEDRSPSQEGWSRWAGRPGTIFIIVAEKIGTAAGQGFHGVFVVEVCDTCPQTDIWVYDAGVYVLDSSTVTEEQVAAYAEALAKYTASSQRAAVELVLDFDG